MRKQRHGFPAGSIVVALVLASAALSANGEVFFLPGKGGHVELVYFARVKDSQTGRPIQRLPYVTIVDMYTGLYIPFLGDSKGHFRSPDIGAAIKEITTQPIDTKQLEIVVSAPGYQTVNVRNIPRQSKGTVELSVTMEPRANASQEGALPKTTPANPPGAAGGTTGAPADSAKPTFFLLATCFGLAAITAVARSVSRPESTEH